MVRVGAVIAVGLVAVGCNAAPAAVPGAAIVERHVDGDTIDVTITGGTERVRLIGIDTPEIAHPASGDRPANPDECMGPEAADHIVALLPLGTPVRLVRDIVARDDYGRLLAYVYRDSDGVFVNLALVEAGLATPLSIEPNTAHAGAIVAAATAAEQSDLGLWHTCIREGSDPSRMRG